MALALCMNDENTDVLHEFFKAAIANGKTTADNKIVIIIPSSIDGEDLKWFLRYEFYQTDNETGGNDFFRYDDILEQLKVMNIDGSTEDSSSQNSEEDCNSDGFIELASPEVGDAVVPIPKVFNVKCKLIN